MADPTEPRRSSVLYALGRLEAQNEEQRREIRELPEQIASIFLPRIVSIEGTLKDHGRRLTHVERRWWMLLGGAATLPVILKVWELITPHG